MINIRKRKQRFRKRYFALCIILSMLFSLMPYGIAEAKTLPSFNRSKVTIYVGGPVTLTLEKAGQNASFSSSKESVVSVKKISRTKVRLIPKIAGKASVTASVSGKKAGCKVIVRYKTYKLINASIGGKDFSIQLYDNESARAFYKKLPMTLTMNELNGNEKYYDMGASLPSKDVAVKKIKTGDLMLYGSDCLALFYKTFPTAYSYTPLGKVLDLDGYEEVMGKDKVPVVFSRSKSGMGRTSTSAITETPALTEILTDTEIPTSDSRVVHIKVGNEILEAELEANRSADEFLALLDQGPVTIEMHDYGNFEKVGPLGQDIVRNDILVTTTPGDIILYQGNQVTIYYDVNTWNFTKLGHIIGATREQLISILGDGNVSVSFYK